MSAACHVCSRPIFDEDDYRAEDLRQVVLDNRLVVDACLRCWLKWPSAHKVLPAFGYGRAPRPRVVFDERGEVAEYELVPSLRLAA